MFDNVLKAAEKASDECKKTLEAVADQYGESTKQAASDILRSLTMTYGVVSMLNSPLKKFMAVDMTARAMAITVRLCQKAYGLTDEQTKEALQLAKEMHKKLLTHLPT